MRVSPAPVYVDDTGTAKGRGVFAGRSFRSGEVVEMAPVIVFRVCDLPRIVATILFQWEPHPKGSGLRAIAFGYGSLYNHANPSNMRYDPDVAAAAIRFTAVRDIASGEELTINYNAVGGGCEWHDDHWFDRMGIKRLPDA